ncbi:MAG: MBL fold metallo-hydrolase [Candidatus Omnitrophota bacterium]
MSEVVCVCNNIKGRNASGLHSAWGLSILLRTGHEAILFDTGSDGGGLIANLRALGIEISDIKKVVISHNHWDHTGGLRALLTSSPGRIDVFLPPAKGGISGDIEALAAGVTEVLDPMEISPHVYSTGVIGKRIKEQALCVKTAGGLLMLAGCAHPGITRMVSAADRIFSDKVVSVLGGFHLEMHPSFVIRFFIRRLKNLGVAAVSASHCTGSAAISMFRSAFGSGFIEMNLGDVYRF